MTKKIDRLLTINLCFLTLLAIVLMYQATRIWAKLSK